MIRVYTAQAIAIVGNVKNVLEANGIPCVLRNEFLSAGQGELPPIECWPEVWVAYDSDAERAKQLVAEATETRGPVEVLAIVVDRASRGRVALRGGGLTRRVAVRIHPDRGQAVRFHRPSILLSTPTRFHR